MNGINLLVFVIDKQCFCVSRAEHLNELQASEL